MSIAVELQELAGKIDDAGDGCFLVTVGADFKPHVVSAQARFADDRLWLRAGTTSRRNATANPIVTLIWPLATAGYSLLVDGAAAVPESSDAEVSVEPARAVLHRLVWSDDDGPSCVTIVG